MSNYLVFATSTVSKAHAVILWHGPFVTLRDLLSTNCTLVKWGLCVGVPLLDGDTIQISEFEMPFLDRDVHAAEIIEAPPQELVAEPPETVRCVLPMQTIGTDASGHGIGGCRGAEWVGDGVAFTLAVQGREIFALITGDALSSHFGACVHAVDGASRAVSACEENHVANNVAAWTRYDATHREPILVRSSDF